MKYLISSDEREAENKPLWREGAEGGIWDQEFMTHPPSQPTHALLAVRRVLLLLHRRAADNVSHCTPHSTAGIWGTSRWDTVHTQKHLKMKHFARDQMLNLTSQTTQIPATLLPSPSILVTLFLEGPNKAITYF